MKWHAIRVTYGRELKFQAVLQQAGYETFVPMVLKKLDPATHRPVSPNPASPNPAGNHPADNHPSSLHPSGIHPAGNHPASNHPADNPPADIPPVNIPPARPNPIASKTTAPKNTAPTPASYKTAAQTKLVPAVSNLLFVRGEQDDLYEFFKGIGEGCPARFIWDKATRNPVTVSDKAMADFITVSNAMLEDTIYLTELNSTLREGQKVRILEGPFKGVEGRIVRIRRSRRILVELPGMLSIAATFIPTDNLEIV